MIWQEKYRQFQLEIGLTFKNEKVLDEALTHSSYVYHNRKVQHNERLEFFGDAVLKLIVSEYLYHKYPQLDEGELTKIRSFMISDHTLYEIASQINLGEYMRFSYGEEKSGGAKKESNLANAMESLIGAHYLDSGYQTIKSFIIQKIEALEKDWLMEETRGDYKSQLQEKLQTMNEALPHYQVKIEEGPEHNKQFTVTVTCEINGSEFAEEGLGKTKKKAEQAAAQKAFKKIG